MPGVATEEKEDSREAPAVVGLKEGEYLEKTETEPGGSEGKKVTEDL